MAWLRSVPGQLWGVLTTVRFPILFSIVFGLLTVCVDQVQDLLWLVAEQGWTWHGGFSLLVAATIYGVNAWYWARLALYARNVPDAALTPFGRWVENHLPRALGAAPYALLAYACYKATDTVQFEPGSPAGRQMWVLIFTNLALCALFYLAVSARRWAFKLPDWQAARDLKVAANAEPGCRPLPFSHLPRAAQWLMLCFPVVVLLVCVLTVSAPAASGRFWGNAPLVLLWGGGFVGIGSALAYLGSRFGLPLLAGLVAFALLSGFFGWDANHTIRLLKGPAETPTTVEAAFKDWFRARAAEIATGTADHPYPVIIVAAAGGGIRAAYWTSYVLAKLEDQNPGAGRHILGLSGVSGGSLGVAAFTAALAQKPSSPDPYAKRLQHYYKAEFLSPLLAGFLVPDLVQRVLPFAVPPFDRARNFEIGLATTAEPIGDQMDLPLSHFYGKDMPSLPYLFLNTTQAQTGLHGVVSPLHFDPAVFPNMVDLSCVSSRIRLATAVHMSARFPFLSPAGELPWKDGAGCQPEPLQGYEYLYVDGGYYDNSGTLTADAIGHAALDAFDAVRLEQALPGTIALDFVYIENDPEAASAALNQGTPPQPDKAPSTSLQDLGTPLVTMLAVRGELGFENLHQFTARIEGQRLHKELLNTDPGVAPPTLLTFSLPRTDKNVPLGWVLSDRSKGEIEQGLDACAANHQPDNCTNWAKLQVMLN